MITDLALDPAHLRSQRTMSQADVDHATFVHDLADPTGAEHWASHQSEMAGH